MSDSLAERLGSSEAVRSLIAEREVADQLEQLGWSAIASSYYRDSETGKMREIDVVGRRNWVRDGGFDEHCARVKLIVECKSISGFHIVINPHDLEDDKHTPFYWLGAEAQPRSDLFFFLTRRGLSEDEAFQVVKGLEEKTTDGMYWEVIGMRPAPLSHPFRASAFRETNIGATKDVSNSVLWRASSSLRSAIHAMIERDVEYHQSWIESGMDDAYGSTKDNITNVAIDWCARQSDFIDIYYPVIVLDAPLWRLEGDAVVQVDWFRLDIPSPSGYNDMWCDVVRSGYSGTYFAELNEHLSRQYADADASPKED